MRQTIQLFHTVLDSIYGVFIFVLPEEKIFAASNRFAALFGVASENLIGHDVDDVFSLWRLAFENTEALRAFLEENRPDKALRDFFGPGIDKQQKSLAQDWDCLLHACLLRSTAAPSG